MRVLFVDDEPRVLDGLANLLHRDRGRWSMTFICGGPAARAAMHDTPFDVIIADMRMPQVTGRDLLESALERSPATARVILSGQIDEAVTGTLVQCAHRILAKPCRGEAIRRVIDGAVGRERLLPDPLLREAAGRVEHLPSGPEALRALQRALAEPDPMGVTAARAVERDAALSAKVVQVARSAFFGLPSDATGVHEAVRRLGPGPLAQILAAARAAGGRQAEAAAAHTAYLGGAVARAIAPTVGADGERAFLAAGLRGVGGLVRPAGGPGTTDPALGAYLLSLWGFPEAVVDAVLRHRAPRAADGAAFDLAGIVHVADALVDDHAPLDLGYLIDSGVSARLPEWRALAHDIIHREESPR